MPLKPGEPTVSMERSHWCPPAGHQKAVSVCLYNRQIMDHPLGCDTCPVIAKYIGKYGMRTYHMVPASTTQLVIRIPHPSTGELLTTTTRDWSKVVVFGEAFYARRINGQLIYLTEADALRMGVARRASGYTSVKPELAQPKQESAPTLANMISGEAKRLAKK